MKPRKFMAMILMGIALFHISSCKKDNENPEDPQPIDNEPEQITTIRLQFTRVSDQSVISVQWTDPDGPGGNNPEIDPISLAANESYDVQLTFLDESGTTSKDLTEEILEEDDEHIICYETGGLVVTSLNIERTDSDGTFEVGLASNWTAQQAGTGTVMITLKHQPDGAKDGTCAPGETDVEVLFDTVIE